MVRVILPLATSITPSALSCPRATYTVRRSGLAARPRGRRPTTIVATTLFVWGEMTATVLSTSLLTYNDGPPERAGRCRAIARSKGRARARCDELGFTGSDSVVEDRLVDVQRVIEPLQ